uniref:Uncharacterized protein n=1 Tax=Peronospora matthiolae TaxID=2874970 RepID=A0AAV1TFN4_9STRA
MGILWSDAEATKKMRHAASWHDAFVVGDRESTTRICRGAVTSGQKKALVRKHERDGFLTTGPRSDSRKSTMQQRISGLAEK